VTNVTELFRRLENFEQSQRDLEKQKEELERLIATLKGDIKEVRGIASQLKEYFDTLSNQNQQLLSPTTSQSEVSMSDVLKLVREMKDV